MHERRAPQRPPSRADAPDNLALDALSPRVLDGSMERASGCWPCRACRKPSCAVGERRGCTSGAAAPRACSAPWAWGAKTAPRRRRAAHLMSGGETGLGPRTRVEMQIYGRGTLLLLPPPHTRWMYGACGSSSRRKPRHERRLAMLHACERSLALVLSRWPLPCARTAASAASAAYPARAPPARCRARPKQSQASPRYAGER